MDETIFDRATIGPLAKTLALFCGTDFPTTVALHVAAENSIDRDVKTAHLLILRSSPDDRRAALALLGD